MKSNPTIFMHSDQDPDEGNTQWGSIAHDNVSMKFSDETTVSLKTHATFETGASNAQLSITKVANA